MKIVQEIIDKEVINIKYIVISKDNKRQIIKDIQKIIEQK